MSAVPREILRTAARLISEQGETPLSPCEVDQDGSVRLCAAAAVAAAGLDTYVGTDARCEFENSLARTFDKGLVVSVYERLGWDSKDCESKMLFNDSSPSDRRRIRVVDMLTSRS